MGFHLKENLAFCVSGGRTIFLDVLADRYFALPAMTDAVFQGLVQQGSVDRVDRRALLPLLDRGMLIEDEHAGALPRAGVLPMPRRALPSPVGAVPVALAARCMIAQIKATRFLRRRALHAQFEAIRLRRVREHPTPRDASDPGWLRLRRGFDRTVALRFHSDQCLVSSFAFLDMAFSGRLDAKLVLGVVAAPFAAHCWIQTGETVMNDRLDYVRSFTPILAV